MAISTNGNKLDPRFELIDAARTFTSKAGWWERQETSARLANGSFWITASGRAKGELTTSDLVCVAANGKVLEREFADLKPSAETAIHQTIYTLFLKLKPAITFTQLRLI